MSKIYRLHEGATEAVQDWTRLDNYLDESAISKIPDSAGANARQQITSIPSPFARIDLVKTAFKQVVAGGHPDGISIFHKMVSDALDVGQIFFNSTMLAGKIKIVPWNPGLDWKNGAMTIEEGSDLSLLLQSADRGHRLYGETLKMFLEQDAAEYNFDQMQQFYLLCYTEAPEHLNIIGGTSPATLFFSSANDLRFIDLTFKNDKVFDQDFCPLHERSEDYILFLYSLRKDMPDFRSRFKVVDDYLDLSLKFMSPETSRKIREIAEGSYAQSYAPIALAGEGNHPEINGFELRGVKIDIEKPGRESDFVIQATQQTTGPLPLVLPAYTFNGNLKYVDGKWPSQLKAPFSDERSLGERTLPGQQIKYPYLTVSDFLEPCLVQLPFEPNAEKFFNGYLPAGAGEGYLLPLTQRFFSYFTTADLLQPLPDGRRMFEFEVQPNKSIKARLRIPVRNGRYIDMERIYDADGPRQFTEPDPVNNRGVIRTQKCSLVIYPFVKRQSDAQAAYTILLLDQDTHQGGQQQYKLKYYKDSEPGREIAPKAQRQKSFRQQHAIDTLYDVVQAEFDLISVETTRTRGCLIPLFPVRRSNNRQYAFAVDFGTTNTHIEYSVDGGQPRALDITAEDQQLGMLHSANTETYNNLNSARFGKGATLLLDNVPREMMPELIGSTARYQFPRRTVLSEPLNIDMSRDTYPLADFSIYWQYDSGVKAKHLQAHTNLKWASISGHDDTRKRIKGYIANIVQLIRNKVVLNDGDLSRTKITWFYPTSMLSGRLQQIEQFWAEQVERYMGPGISITRIPESVAPFYFFRNEKGVRGGNEPVINIDIGGGTTDVVVYKGEKINSYTSFRYAGNALFGDVYKSPPSANGFVQFFERHCRDMLNGTLLGQYLPSKDNIERSDEFITALFGLQQHPERGEISFSFTEKLNATEELKIVPLLFISSIFYHVARYQKYKEGGMPLYITFSGTASKMLQILDVSPQLSSMTRLANLIFNDVFRTDSANIRLVAANGPKQVTAKGGLYQPAVPTEDKFILFGCEDALGYRELTYSDAYDEKIGGAVVKEVETFIDAFFGWSSKLDFANEFALDTRRYAIFKKVLKAGLPIYLVEGVDEMQEEMSTEVDGRLQETLFFMPLKGALNKLAFYIMDPQQDPGTTA